MAEHRAVKRTHPVMHQCAEALGVPTDHVVLVKQEPTRLVVVFQPVGSAPEDNAWIAVCKLDADQVLREVGRREVPEFWEKLRAGLEQG